MENIKGKMTVAEAGRKGGQRTAQTHGREFYEEIGKKGGEKTSEKYGKEFYVAIGKKGGNVPKKKRVTHLKNTAKTRKTKQKKTA